MASKVYTKLGSKQTPQSEPIPGEAQVKNSAGGFVYQATPWTQLRRFLILGTEGGTYYVNERTLTVQNAQNVKKCISLDGVRVVKEIVDVSDSGRAPKNDPALFALAMCASLGDDKTKSAAFEALPKVARISTHLFHFAEYVQQFRGWGRGLRKAVARWYTEKTPANLAYQVVKYRQRDGWTHKDLLALSHPNPSTSDLQIVTNYIAGGWDTIGPDAPTDEYLQTIWAYEKASHSTDPKEIVKLINDYDLTWEMIPTTLLNDKDIWEALLHNMPMTAMIRNLGKLTNLGIIKDFSQNLPFVVSRITDQTTLQKARIHPISVLIALRTYQQGHGEKGNLNWQPVRQVVDALDEAFYLSFGNVKPTNLRIMKALDVSGSMTMGNISGMPITPREACAALAMISARVESNYMTTIFSSAGTQFYKSKGTSAWGSGNGISVFDVSPRERLDDIIRKTGDLPFGGTDCSLPMMFAADSGYPIDVFEVYTDNETWAGLIHPSQALRKYRDAMGINAKLAVIGMTATEFSIADPKDAGMLDCVGFDTATPNIISDFALGLV